MPEGPECRLYAEALNNELEGKLIRNVEILSGRYAKTLPEGYELFTRSLPRRVLKVSVKGKFIYFHLNADKYIWSTLGMTGAWVTRKESDARLAFHYDGGTLYYSDVRNFGTLKFRMSQEDTDKKLASLGYDLLNCAKPSLEMTRDVFGKKKNQTKTLAQILMDQKNYAGVGNYIKAEALYRARLSPHRTGESLSEEELLALHNAIVNVIRGSYASKTQQFVHYTDMQECGQEFKKVVYKKAQDPLGNNVIQEETKDKRTTHWVPALQK